MTSTPSNSKSVDGTPDATDHTGDSTVASAEAPATDSATETATRTDAVRALAFQVWNFKQGEMVSLMIHLGDRLSLYRAMVDKGPLTSTQLADETGLNERWVREWLLGQAAAGLLEYHDPNDRDDPSTARFELTDIAAEVLANEETSLEFAAGAFTSPVDGPTIDRIAEAFKTGIGLSYQQLGPCAAHRTERMLGPWARQALVPVVLPGIASSDSGPGAETMHHRLRKGIDVADVGCGSGVALLAMAKAYPTSRFTGFDPSEHAIERAKASAEELELTNVEFTVAQGEDLADICAATPSFDFIITFDCLHDMTHPEVVTEAIYRALRDDGTWLIKDIRCDEDFRKNQRNPMLAMFYGFSITACMSSALSVPGGAGLGTVGLPPSKAEAMTRDAGFRSFKIHDFEDPANLYYVVGKG